MTQPAGQDPQVQQILDRLKITPQQLFGEPINTAEAARSTVDRLEPDLVRADRPLWPALFWRINLDTLSRSLENALNAVRVGYCYMLKRNGKLAHGRSVGWAQLPPTNGPDTDDGSVAWQYHVPMNVGSVSKFVTAVAVVRLLNDLNIPLATPIVDFLPAYWRPHFTVSQISFRALLRHESGLGRALNTNGLNSNSGPGDFLTAKMYVFTGGPQDGQRDYKNLNYAVLRVAFAVLSGIDRTVSFAQMGIPDDRFWDLASAIGYANYVNDVVFGAADIAPRQFKADDIAAKAYATPPVAPGSRAEDDIGDAGSGGWHLSVGELTRLLHEFRHGRSIMAPSRARSLLANLYGLDGVILTKAGPVYSKGGRCFFTAGGGQALDSAIYLMPDGVDLVIFVNAVPRPPAVTPPAGVGPRPRASHLDGIPGMILNSIELSL
jgi:beta-lactamase family protein